MRLNRETAKCVDRFLCALKDRTSMEFDIEIDQDSGKLYIPFLSKKIWVSVLDDVAETLAEKCHMLMSQYVFELIQNNANFDMICEFWNSKSATVYGRLSREDGGGATSLEEVAPEPLAEKVKAPRKNKKK